MKLYLNKSHDILYFNINFGPIQRVKSKQHRNTECKLHKLSVAQNSTIYYRALRSSRT